MTNLKKNGLGQFLCMGASALVLASCMPDDSRSSHNADTSHNESQVAHYGQAFQQYSAQSLQAVMASNLWKTQTLDQGELNLKDSDFGSLDLGDAEAYLASAYCVVADTPKHLTWFKGDDGKGSLHLKGLGVAGAGNTAMYLRQRIASENLGVQHNGTIEMADGSELDLSGNCAKLNIPHGSAVAVLQLSAPVNVAEVQEKYIMRNQSCPPGTEGQIIQRVLASYTANGQILVESQSFVTEAQVAATDNLSWSEVANNCLSPTEAIARSVTDTAANALNLANIGTDGAIKTILASNLTQVDCAKIMKGDQEDNDKLSEEEREEIYNTCSNPVEITPVDPIDFNENLNEIDIKEDLITAACGGDPESDNPVTLDPENGMGLNGVHPSLIGKPGLFHMTAFSGDVVYKRIKHFYRITGKNTQTSDDPVRVYTKFEGDIINCRRDDDLTIGCDQIIGDGGDIIDNDPLRYQRMTMVDEWKDKEGLVPADMTIANWAQTQMNCARRAHEDFACPADMITGKAGDKTQVISATIPGDIQQSEWTTAEAAKCQKEGENRRAVVRATTDADAGGVLNKYGYRAGLGCNSSKYDDHITINTTIDVYYDYNLLDHNHNSLGIEMASTPTQSVPVTFATGDRDTDFNRSWHWSCRDAIDNTLASLGFTGFGGEVSKRSIAYSGGNVSGGISIDRLSCFADDTPVLMADGSTRPIASLREGDLTATGRIKRIYARGFDPDDLMSDTAQNVYRGGLYLYRGICVTGNHVVNENGRWIEVADSDRATLVYRNIRIVYNLDVENFIIPVMDENGQAAYFADNLNNIGRASARGLFYISIDDGIAA